MNLFDEEFNNIVDSESTSSKVLSEQREYEFKEWKESVLKLRKPKDDIYNKTNVVHNISEIEQNTGNSISLYFDVNIEKNVILCPISYLISCPLIITNINVINNINNNKDIRLILYNTCTYDKDNINKQEEVCNISDLQLIDTINFNDINITDILFRGTFNNFDEYHTYIDIMKSKFKNANIWMHYETKILHPGVKYQNNKNFIASLLRYDDLIDDIIYHDIVNISYCKFLNNRTLSNK